MRYVYAVLGSGRQGTASAYDLARFGEAKRDTLPAYCRRCEVLKHCQGECPKHRFMTTPDGEPGLQYLCPSFKRFFNHIKPQLQFMASLIRARRSPAEIMRIEG